MSASTKPQFATEYVQPTTCSGKLPVYELVEVVISYIPYTSFTARSIRAVSKGWRRAALMCQTWEGGIVCKAGCHILLNPAKLVADVPRARKRLKKRNGEEQEQQQQQHQDDDCSSHEDDENAAAMLAMRSFTMEYWHDKEVGLAFALPNSEWLLCDALAHVYFDSWPLDLVVSVQLASEHTTLRGRRPVNELDSVAQQAPPQQQQQQQQQKSAQQRASNQVKGLEKQKGKGLSRKQQLMEEEREREQQTRTEHKARHYVHSGMREDNPATHLFVARLMCEHYFPSLTSLDVSHTTSCPVVLPIVQSVAGRGNLKHFRAAHCDFLTDDLLVTVISCNSDLETIDVGGSHFRSETVDLSTASKKGVVKLTSITDTSICFVPSCCPNLTSLSVAQHTAIRDDSIIQVVSVCRNLTYLDISSSRITDSIIAPLVESNSGVFRAFLAKDCSGISAQGVTALVERFGKGMTCLSVGYVSSYSYSSRDSPNDNTVCCIAERCPELTHLDVSKAAASDKSICEIAKKCPRLKTLDIRDTEGRVTDASMDAIAAYCVELEGLNVSNTAVTINGVIAVLKSCKQLRELDACNGNQRMTPAIVEELKRSPRMMRFTLSYTSGVWSYDMSWVL